MKKKDNKRIAQIKSLKRQRGIEREVLKEEKLFYQWIQPEKVFQDKKKKASREASRKYRRDKKEE